MIIVEKWEELNHGGVLSYGQLGGTRRKEERIVVAGTYACTLVKVYGD